MITEDYVSYETAKLLKEKRFDEPVTELNMLLFKEDEKPILKITHQKAMKWLREVHNLLIEVGINNLGYWYMVDDIINKDENLIPITKANYEGYKTYEEAVEAALKYSLENLI